MFMRSGLLRKEYWTNIHIKVSYNSLFGLATNEQIQKERTEPSELGGQKKALRHDHHKEMNHNICLLVALSRLELCICWPHSCKVCDLAEIFKDLSCFVVAMI